MTTHVRATSRRACCAACAAREIHTTELPEDDTTRVTSTWRMAFGRAGTPKTSARAEHDGEWLDSGVESRNGHAPTYTVSVSGVSRATNAAKVTLNPGDAKANASSVDKNKLGALSVGTTSRSGYSVSTTSSCGEKKVNT